MALPNFVLRTVNGFIAFYQQRAIGALHGIFFGASIGAIVDGYHGALQTARQGIRIGAAFGASWGIYNKYVEGHEDFARVDAEELDAEAAGPIVNPDFTINFQAIVNKIKISLVQFITSIFGCLMVGFY